MTNHTTPTPENQQAFTKRTIYNSGDGYYLLIPVLLPHASRCDGCDKNTGTGYDVYSLGNYNQCVFTAIWICCLDCARNSILGSGA